MDRAGSSGKQRDGGASKGPEQLDLQSRPVLGAALRGATVDVAAVGDAAKDPLAAGLNAGAGLLVELDGDTRRVPGGGGLPLACATICFNSFSPFPAIAATCDVVVRDDGGERRRGSVAGEPLAEAVLWKTEARQRGREAAVDAGLEAVKPASRGRRPASGDQCGQRHRGPTTAAGVGGASRRAAGR